MSIPVIESSVNEGGSNEKIAILYTSPISESNNI
jgi:hypothetical protein